MSDINLNDFTVVLPEHATIKQRRIDLGLSLDQVAHDAKIKPEHLERYEEGTRTISSFTRRRLLRVIGESDPM